MNDADRIRWAKALAFAGWMSLLSYLTYLIGQLRRAALQQGSFEDGQWGQRIELISHATLPQNVIVLMAGVAAAIGGTLLVRSLVDPVVVHLARLVRVIAGLGVVLVGLATIGIIAVFFRTFDSIGDVNDVLARLGGIALAAAAIRLCLEAERET